MGSIPQEILFSPAECSALEQKPQQVPRCFPRPLLGPARSQHFPEAQSSAACLDLGFFFLVCFLARGKSYRCMGKHSQCLELD